MTTVIYRSKEEEEEILNEKLIVLTRCLLAGERIKVRGNLYMLDDKKNLRVVMTNVTTGEEVFVTPLSMSVQAGLSSLWDLMTLITDAEYLKMINNYTLNQV